jgi:hypothetical protein
MKQNLNFAEYILCTRGRSKPELEQIVLSVFFYYPTPDLSGYLANMPVARWADFALYPGNQGEVLLFSRNITVKAILLRLK